MFLIGKLKELKKEISEKSQNLQNKIKAEVQEIFQENQEQQNIQKEQESKLNQAQFPWENLKPLKRSNQNGNSQFMVKECILNLYKNEENFIIDEESYMYEFEFKMADYVEIAIKICEYDENLAKLRHRLVPRKIKDEIFWKNYFYNIEVIKIQFNMENNIYKQNEENIVSNMITSTDQETQKSPLQFIIDPKEQEIQTNQFISENQENKLNEQNKQQQKPQIIQNSSTQNQQENLKNQNDSQQLQQNDEELQNKKQMKNFETKDQYIQQNEQCELNQDKEEQEQEKKEEDDEEDGDKGFDNNELNFKLQQQSLQKEEDQNQQKNLLENNDKNDSKQNDNDNNKKINSDKKLLDNEESNNMNDDSDSDDGINLLDEDDVEI